MSADGLLFQHRKSPLAEGCLVSRALPTHCPHSCPHPLILPSQQGSLLPAWCAQSDTLLAWHYEQCLSVAHDHVPGQVVRSRLGCCPSPGGLGSEG